MGLPLLALTHDGDTYWMDDSYTPIDGTEFGGHLARMSMVTHYRLINPSVSLFDCFLFGDKIMQVIGVNHHEFSLTLRRCTSVGVLASWAWMFKMRSKRIGKWFSVRAKETWEIWTS